MTTSCPRHSSRGHACRFGVRRRGRRPRRPGSPSPAERAGPCSTTTCGTSPPWHACPPSCTRAAKLWDFTAITDPGFRLVAKELLFALLAPQHQAVAALPHAYRVPLAIPTCRERLTSVTSWLNWLTGQGITSLAQVTQQHCDAYLDHRRHARDSRAAGAGTRPSFAPGNRGRRAGPARLLRIVHLRRLPARPASLERETGQRHRRNGPP